jgi:hypothetical protein
MKSFQMKVIPAKSVVRSVNERQTIQWPKENRQLSQNTTLKMKDEQQESHTKKPGELWREGTSCSTSGTPVVFIKKKSHGKLIT